MKNINDFTCFPLYDSIWNKPLSITISDLVTISPQTKTITYHENYTPDAAAKVFWECVCHPSYDVIKKVYAKEIAQHFDEIRKDNIRAIGIEAVKNELLT